MKNITIGNSAAHIFGSLPKKNKLGILTVVFLSVWAGILDYLSIFFLGMLISSGLTKSGLEFSIGNQIIQYIQASLKPYALSNLEAYGLLAVFTGLASWIFKIFNQWLAIKTINSAATALNGKILNEMINPSSFVSASRESSDSGAVMLYDTNRIHSFLTSLTQIFTNSVLLVFVAGSVFAFLSKGVFILLGSLFVFYILCVKTCKSFMVRSGQVMAMDEKQMLRTAAFIGRNLREILVENLGQSVKKQFQSRFLSLKNNLGKIQIVTLLPSRAGELLLLLFISGAILFSETHSGPSSGVLNQMLLLVIAAQKVLPSLQMVFSYWASLQGCMAGLGKAIALLSLPAQEASTGREMSTFRSLTMKGVYYRFPETQTWAVANMNLKFKRGEKIGLTGPSGSGKSTCLDLVALLLRPQVGRISINGIKSEEISLKDWWARLSYIPQDVLLVGGSVVEAVTGQKAPSPQQVEEARKALQQVGWDFPRDASENWEARKIGEFGSSLSGGQRRKIAAARSLFSKKEVILLDEVTASLDEASEKALLRAFLCLKKTTVIIVSHQNSTLSQCEKTIRLRSAGKQ